MNKKENFENWFYNLCEKIGKIIDDNDLWDYKNKDQRDENIKKINIS